MAPKRQRLQADSPETGPAAERGAVPPLEPAPPSSSSFNGASENRDFLAKASTVKIPDDNSHATETPTSATARGGDGQTNVYGALPGITRKITACAACRKNKIKCDMPPDGPPCTRCRRRSLSCVLNRSLQSLLEDTKNTDNLRVDIQNLHQTLGRVCAYLKLEDPQALLSITGDQNVAVAQPASSIQPPNDTEGCEVSPPESPSAAHAPIDTFLEMAKMGRPPSSSDSPSGRRRPELVREDLVSRSIISSTTAQSLLDRYFTRLDHYIYGFAGGLYDLHKLKQQSPALLAAICTVSALHDAQDSRLYEICNRELRHLVSRAMFEKRDINYIRALCISSFWLADASRILSSDAIRRAADLRLHRLDYNNNTSALPHNMAVSTALNSPDVKLTDRLRLWYLLFICDQHLSILHNRDALLRADRAVNVDWESYIHHPDTTQDDIRILSQVSLLLIMSEMRDTLSCDYETQVPQILFSQMNNYARRLDRWFNKFSALFQPNHEIANFPRKGLELHYQFSKLYLGHHVFRNLNGQPVPSHCLAAAVAAHDAAVSIFDMILSDTTLHTSLVGMPHYFHIMIAFAGNFLLEICKNYHNQLGIGIQNDFALVEQVLEVFHTIPCIPQHPIYRTTLGLGRKLYDCASSVGLSAENIRGYAYGYGHAQNQPLMHAGVVSGAGVVGGATGMPHDQPEYSTMNGQPLSQLLATTPDDFFLFPDLNFGFADIPGMMGVE